MKKILLSILTLMLLAVSARAQQQIIQDTISPSQPPAPQSGSAWTQVDIGATQPLNDVFFLNKDTGWVTGVNGLFSTTDAGQHWSLNSQLSGLGQIQFLDARHGWVSGGGGSNFYLTTTAAVTWISQNPFGSGAGFGPQAWEFADSIHGVGCAGPHVTMTTDGGNTWTRQDVDASSLTSISYPGYPYAYCVDASPLPWPKEPGRPVRSVIQKTTDGGITWTRLENDSLVQSLNVVKALDSMHVLIGSGGMTAVTWDGGKTWQITHIDCDVTGFFFSDSNHGWLAGQGPGNFGSNGFLAQTSDGGKTWIPVSFDSVNIETNGPIVFLDSNNGWLTAQEGLFQTITGGVNAVQPQPSNSSALLLTNYPDPFNTTTTISFNLPKPQHANLSVYDLSGRQVSTLLKGALEIQGRHSISFDANSLPAGAYTYKLNTEQYSGSGKLTLIK